MQIAYRFQLSSSILVASLGLGACGGSPQQAAAAPPPPAAVPAASAAPEPQAKSAPEYLIKVPKGWTRESKDGAERFVDPDGTVVLTLRIVQEDDLDKAVDATIKRRKIAHKERARTSSPGDDVFDEVRVATFVNDDQSQLAQIIARSRGELAVVMVVSGPMKDVSRRQAELHRLIGSVELKGVKKLELKPADMKPLTDAKRDELFAFVDELRTQAQVPGVAMAIVEGDHVEARGLGVRKAGGKPVDADTQFMIGSVTKSFSTLLMATLADDSKLDWDDAVTKHRASFKLANAEATSQLKMRHLFCACTGLPRDDFSLVFEFAKSRPGDLFTNLAKLAPTTEFGETFQYNNQLTGAGGYIAAQLAEPKTRDLNRAYTAALKKRVLTPIGMTSSMLSRAAVKRRGNYAVPHRKVRSATEVVPLEQESFVDPVAPAGALWSTATDMAKYIQLQLKRGVAQDGERVVSEKNLGVTQTPGVKAGDKGAYGLGWVIGKSHGLRTIGHGGGTFGFNTQVVFFPDLNVGLLVVANRSPNGGVLRGAIGRMIELLFDKDLKVRAKFDKARSETARLIQEAEAKIDTTKPPRELAGRYRHPKLGPVVVTQRPKELLMDVGEWSARLVALKPSEGARRLRLVGGPLDGMTVRYTLKPEVTLIMNDGQHDLVLKR